VILYAPADGSLPEHQTIETALRAVLADEPGWAGTRKRIGDAVVFVG